MMFHTVAFIVAFLPPCVAGFFLLGRFYGNTSALAWLIACNLFFYAWWNPAQLPLLIGSVAGNFAIGWKLRHTPAPRPWLAAGIAANLALLGWFKYADFLLHIAVPSAPALHITLPLAISFFTFQQIVWQRPMRLLSRYKTVSVCDFMAPTLRTTVDPLACSNARPGAPGGWISSTRRPGTVSRLDHVNDEAPLRLF